MSIPHRVTYAIDSLDPNPVVGENMNNATKAAKVRTFIYEHCGGVPSVMERHYGLIWRCYKCHEGNIEERLANQARLYDSWASEPQLAALLEV